MDFPRNRQAVLRPGSNADEERGAGVPPSVGTFSSRVVGQVSNSGGIYGSLLLIKIT